MKRAGVGAAVVLVLALFWLLADSAGVFRAERKTAEHSESRREGIADSPGNAGPDTKKSTKERAYAPALPAPVDLSKVDLDLDLHGIVVDENDKPIAGARLQTVSYPTRRANTLNVDRNQDEAMGPATRSASNGTFAIRLERGSLRDLRVSADGFASTQLRDCMAGEYVKVVLTPGVTVLVVVSDEQKQPVPDVALRVFSNARSPAQVTRKGTTDERGLARLEAMPGGLAFWVEPAHATLGSPSWVAFTTPKSGEQRLDITMMEGRTLTGRVIDAQTRAPIKGARVGMGWTMRRHTFTDENGEYTLKGWSGRGVQELAVDSPRFAQAIKRVGNAERIDFELVPGVEVFGRIVDGSHRPVPGARVDAVGSVRQSQSQVTSRRYGQSGADGMFRLEGLNADLVHSLVVVADGFGRTLVDFAPARPEKDLGDIVLSEARSIEGVVLDGDRKPLARLRVVLTDAGPKERSWPRIMYGNKESRYTDHLGRFRFPEQSPGTFQLAVRRPGRKPVDRVVTLTAEKDLLGVELAFAAGADFVVWVHDDEGNPIAGAYCILQYQGGNAQARTDEQGAARFVVTGPVTNVQAPFLPDENAYIRPDNLGNIDPSQKEVRFVFRKGVVTEGVVRLDGKPLSLARVEIWRNGKRVKSIFSGEDGTFRIVGPADERIDLILRGRFVVNKRGGMQSDTKTVVTGELRNVTPGSEDVVLRARKAPNDGKLTVRVQDAEGNPVSGVQVSVGQARSRTGEDGAVVFEELPRAETNVYVGIRPDLKGQLPPGPLRITPSGQEVVLRFEKGVPVTGTVLDPGGGPASGVAVFALMQARFLGSAVSDAAGRFTVYVPAAFEGKIRLQANKQDKGGARYMAQTEYVPGAAIELQLAKQ